jgi:hypothetical protein
LIDRVVSEYIAGTLSFRNGAIAGRVNTEVDEHNVGRPPEAVKIAARAPTGRAPARRLPLARPPD